MSVHYRRACVEMLENRAYATLVSESSMTVRDDPDPASVQPWFTRVEKSPAGGMTARLAGSVIRVQGTFGDDSVRIRALSRNRIEIKIYSRETYHAFAKPSERVLLTTTTARRYVFDGQGKRISIDGGDGEDTVKARGLGSTDIHSSAVTKAAR
ncbi:MAG TPA: hypothetical protein VF595_05495 [Tepidisphaeraceae bacterium]|jgi:hypothetical protein